MIGLRTISSGRTRSTFTAYVALPLLHSFLSRKGCFTQLSSWIADSRLLFLRFFVKAFYQALPRFAHFDPDLPAPLQPAFNDPPHPPPSPLLPLCTLPVDFDA